MAAKALDSIPSLTGPFVIGIDGKHLTDAERRRLQHPHVGGVILFMRNYENPAQLLELTAEIRAVRSPPLHISVDHEGGRVQRFRPGFTVLPAMRRLGALWDRDVLFACRVATSVGYVIGSELRAHGVDFSYAPVVDVEWGRSEVIGDRSLHRDARVVTMLSSHLNQGLALAGMANCCKHWPGHGWAVADSHVAIPDDTRPVAEILAADGAPYKWLGVGITSVMAAHIVYSQLDPKPAGFARRWIQDKLRGELGYTGAVFSDDLLMVGASGMGSVVDRARGAGSGMRPRADLQGRARRRRRARAGCLDAYAAVRSARRAPHSARPGAADGRAASDRRVPRRAAGPGALGRDACGVNAADRQMSASGAQARSM
jgi:beta-N-acetylhexosaminidase